VCESIIVKFAGGSGQLVEVLWLLLGGTAWDICSDRMAGLGLVGALPSLSCFVLWKKSLSYRDRGSVLVCENASLALG
jgi:hypothetical protein